MQQLFRTRTHGHDDYRDSGLKRCLSAFDLTLMGIGAIIGTGIFVLTGIAAATQSGPAVVLSFVIAGFACAFAALSYAELAGSLGGCGSAYGYSYAAFGELIAWLIGWNLLLEYGMAVAAVANGWSGYFLNGLSSIGVELPAALIAAPSKGGLVNLPALLVILALMGMLIVGVKESARLNALMVGIKLTVIAIFLFAAIGNVNLANWSPFMPFGWFTRGADGHTVGVLAGAALVFFAFIGFDAVTTAAEEAKDPQRDLPIGILSSLAICTVVYIVVAGVLTGVVSYTELNVPSPVAHALQLLGHRWASGAVAVGVIAGLLTVMLVLYYGLTRILLAMARDGLLPAFFTIIHPTTQTPVPTIVFVGVVCALFAGFVPLGELAELVNIGTLFAFVMVCIGVIVLRVNQPNLPRPFRTPWHPVIPILGAASCAALMGFLPAITWWRFSIWLGIGVVYYFAYSYHHSKLAADFR
ncbi:MAG: amino acid permease [Gammaproteobacteria bacterium]|nr:amino acid permease [Gammaproteobacteria bacterium]